jgi:hypothetical protein
MKWRTLGGICDVPSSSFPTNAPSHLALRSVRLCSYRIHQHPLLLLHYLTLFHLSNYFCCCYCFHLFCHNSELLRLRIGVHLNGYREISALLLPLLSHAQEKVYASNSLGRHHCGVQDGGGNLRDGGQIDDVSLGDSREVDGQKDDARDCAGAICYEIEASWVARHGELQSAWH